MMSPRIALDDEDNMNRSIGLYLIPHFYFVLHIISMFILYYKTISGAEIYIFTPDEFQGWEDTD